MIPASKPPVQPAALITPSPGPCHRGVWLVVHAQIQLRHSRKQHPGIAANAYGAPYVQCLLRKPAGYVSRHCTTQATPAAAVTMLRSDARTIAVQHAHTRHRQDCSSTAAWPHVFGCQNVCQCGPPSQNYSRNSVQVWPRHPKIYADEPYANGGPAIPVLDASAGRRCHVLQHSHRIQKPQHGRTVLPAQLQPQC
jgi:hypothetical protein